LSSSAASIAEALACGKRGCDCASTARRGSGNTHCPGHTDDKPSLHVSEGTDGKVLLHCFVCGKEKKDDILAALRERGLWETRPEGRRNGRNNIVATYTYPDEGGRPLFEVCRTAKKTFPQRRPGASEWGIEGVRRVLYRLPELLAADPSEIVCIVEGEKDTDRLRGLGFVATTSPGGAGKWKREYSQYLKGRKVRIIPDNDETGHSHAQNVAASLVGVAADVRILELPDLPEHGDISDWLDAGGTADRLRELAAAAPVWESEPTPDGAELLDDLTMHVRKYVVLAPSQVDTLALWTLHSYAIEAAECTPYIHVTSPEKRCGKSLLEEVEESIVNKPWLTGRVSAAVLIRRLERDAPTLLLDEADGVFKVESEYSEALRSILNSGHRRGCPACLCVKSGAGFELAEFKVWGPKCIAGIGRLPDTVADRSIRIELRRRAPNEPVARFRRREVEAEARPLKERAARWTAAHLEALRTARPSIPSALDDRAADGWEPLLAIGDAAGGDWPRRARLAALALSCGDARDDDSLGVKLLADIRTVFEERGVDRLSSAELLASLNAIEESPWGDLKGKPLEARRLARLLRPYGIKPGTIRLADGQTPKGYSAEAFSDAWSRYLLSPDEPPQAQQPPQAPDSDSADVADVADVAANSGVHARALVDAAGRSPLVQAALDMGATLVEPDADDNDGDDLPGIQEGLESEAVAWKV
jgi:hypothetical protein